MTLLSRFRATVRPADRVPSRLLLLTGLLVLGLLLLLCHVAAESPLDHGGCYVCKTLQHVLVVIPPTIVFGIVIFVPQCITPSTAFSERPLRFRGRAPPVFAFA